MIQNFFLKLYARNFPYGFQKFCIYKLIHFPKLFWIQNNFWNFCQDFLTSMITRIFFEFSEFIRTLYWRFSETFLIFSQYFCNENHDNCKMKSFEISIFNIFPPSEFPHKNSKTGHHLLTTTLIYLKPDQTTK